MITKLWQTNMDIKTKYDIGDTVYFLDDNEMAKGTVKGFLVKGGSDVLEGFQEKYTVEFFSPYWREVVKKDFDVDRLFATPADLWAALTADFSEYEKEEEK